MVQSILADPAPNGGVTPFEEPPGPLLANSGGLVRPPGVGTSRTPASDLFPGLSIPLSLSPATAIELIDTLTAEQLNREVEYLKFYFPDFGLNKQHEPYTKRHLICKAFKEQYNTSSTAFIDAMFKARTDTTLNSPLPALSKEISELRGIVDSLKTVPRDPAPQLDPSLLVIPPLITPLEDPVSFHNIEIDDIDVDTFIQELKSLGLKFVQIGKRLVIHFGKYYKYGRVVHDACDYPTDSPLFWSVHTKMKILFPEIDILTHSCTVTLYPNGSYFMPRHPDNESYIKPGSMIRTANLGADRPVVFTNTVGPLDKRSHMLTHGSVYSMTRKSQDQWSHAIPVYHSCTKPRVSIVYRELIDPTPHTPVKPPPFTPPSHSTPARKRLMPDSFYATPNPSTPVRILVLSDSNNITLPTHMFPPNHVVIVKPLMQLTAITDYENEFQYSDYVIISSGINELTRYNYTGQSLFDYISPLLLRFCALYSSTTFLFSTLLNSSSRFRNLSSWLNPRVDRLNNLMFNLTLEVKKTSHNIFLLDIDSLTDPAQSINPYGNGVHTVLSAKKLFTNTLKLALCLLTSTPHKELQGFTWPLRPAFMGRVQ